MRIVQLANFHSPTSGGLRVAVDTLRAGYFDAGHECTLVAPGRVDEVDGTVRRVRAPRLPNRSGYRVILRRRAVLALLDELRPHVVEVHDKLLQQWVWTWSRARRVPVIAVSHERLAHSLPLLMPFAPDGAVRSATAAVARLTALHCDVLVTCSRFAAAEFASAAPDRRLRVVPLGVDLDAFRPAGRESTGRQLRLVTVGRLSPEKRPDLALETLRILRADAELTLAGTGPMREALTQQARGLPVRFAGHLAGRIAVAASLAAADIALAPGPAETFGLAALEAMACGTPIVTVEGAAPSELIEAHPAAGRTAPPEPAAFARAVREIAAVAAPTRSAAARRCAESFPWSATVAAMLDLHAEFAPRITASAAG